MELDKISASQLKQSLEADSSSILVLDCRSFLAYSNERVVGAKNVFCPSILKRRFVAKGFLNLDNILSIETRKKLKTGQYTRLVLYDVTDMDVSSGKNGTSEFSIIFRGLQRNSYSIKGVSILKGGFKRFRTEYPQLCTGSRSSEISGSSNNKGHTTTTTATSTTTATTTTTAIPVYSGSISLQKSYPTELLPHLFIGDEFHSVNKELLERIGVTAILNVSTTCPNHYSTDYTYKVIPVQDHNAEDIGSWLIEAIQFIESVRQNNGRVLVHCKAGVSRSATICIAYIMYRKSLRVEQAFEYVRNKRSIISPNINFMQQLIEFETVLTLRQMNGTVMCPSVSQCNKCTETQSINTSGFPKLSACAMTTDATGPLLSPTSMELQTVRL